MKRVACRESGYTEQELFRNGQKHVLNMHGMKSEEFTPQFNEKLRPRIEEYDMRSINEGVRY